MGLMMFVAPRKRPHAQHMRLDPGLRRDDVRLLLGPFSLFVTPAQAGAQTRLKDGSSLYCIPEREVS